MEERILVLENGEKIEVLSDRGLYRLVDTPRGYLLFASPEQVGKDVSTLIGTSPDHYHQYPMKGYYVLKVEGPTGILEVLKALFFGKRGKHRIVDVYTSPIAEIVNV